MPSSKVLSVGYERELLQVRSLLLMQSLKLNVVEALDLATALEIARGKEQIDLIVLCHTVPVSHQFLIIEAARRTFIEIPALSIFPGVCDSDSAGTPVSNDPHQLLKAVREALDICRIVQTLPQNDGALCGND